MKIDARARRVPLVTVVLASAATVAAGFAIAAATAPKKDPLTTAAVIAPKASTALILGLTQAGTAMVAVGERGVILRSVDGGKSWAQAASPVSVNLTAVAFANDRLGFAVGHDGVILRTQDGGATWTKPFDGANANQQMIALAKARLDSLKQEAAGARKPSKTMDEAIERQQRLLEDTEAGAKFGPSRPLLDIAFADERVGYAVGSYGQIFKTEDAGQNWKALSDRMNNPDSFHYNGVRAMVDGTVIVAGEQGRVYLSQDAGQSFELLETGYRGHLYGALRLKDEARSLLAYGFGGHVFKRSGAQPWTEITTGVTESLTAAHVSQEGVITLLDQSGNLLQSRDNGESFAKVSHVSGALMTALLMKADGKSGWVGGKGGIQPFGQP